MSQAHEKYGEESVSRVQATALALEMHVAMRRTTLRSKRTTTSYPNRCHKGHGGPDAGPTINAMPLDAAICSPGSGESLPAGEVPIEGYAIAYERGVSRVEMSLNGGRNWRQAAFADDPEGQWSWRRWSLGAELPKGRQHLVVRAFDDAGQGQPERPDTMWNFAGYLCTAWHHVHVLVE